VVRWCVAVLASAVGLVFAGNPNVIVGGDPSVVGGVLVVVLFIMWRCAFSGVWA
jgi:hypothetical protein